MHVQLSEPSKVAQSSNEFWRLDCMTGYQMETKMVAPDMAAIWDTPLQGWF